ncbi:MAG: hypothetical protein ACLFUR_02965 [Candidatus Hadarchaeia archaeon]
MGEFLDLVKENRKVKLGILLAFLGVMVALAAIDTSTEFEESSGFLEPGQSLRMIRTGSIEGEVTFANKMSETDNELMVDILDTNGNVETEIVLGPGESKTVDLDMDSVYFRGRDTNSNILSYSYRIDYTTLPYRYLSIPAMLISIFGVFLIYKGLQEYSRVTEGKREENIKEGEHVDFMGIDGEDDDE